MDMLCYVTKSEELHITDILPSDVYNRVCKHYGQTEVTVST